MAGNGDERQAAAWERVEARLDRLIDRVDAIEGTLDRHGEALLRLERHAERTDLRLDRIETDLDLIKLLLDGVRHEVDLKLARLKHELIDALGQQTRVELLAAQSLNEDRLARLERRIEALEAAR